MSFTLGDPEKHHALIALYNETNSEITRYRDYEWKLPLWSALLLVFVVGIVKEINASNFLLSHKIILRTILGCFSAIATSFSCWYIYSIHSRLTKNRIIRRKISILLKFVENGSYEADDTLLSQTYAVEDPSFKDGLSHVVASWLFVLLTLAYASFFIFYS